MKKLLLLALFVPACVVGSDGSSTPPPGDDTTTPPPDDTGISGSIASDQTWSGTVEVTGATTIESGATVTVMPGTTVHFGQNAGLTVNGALDIQGQKGSEVQLIPAVDGQFFGGLHVAGTLNMSYAVQHNGSLVTVGGTSTITDSVLYGASGDFLILSGGTVNVTYSLLGAPDGVTDTTHCNMHFGGTGNNITVTNSNIVGSPYALMLYGGQNAVMTNNNWLIDRASSDPSWVDSQTGTSADFSGSFFSDGYVPTAKAGATFTFDNPAAAMLTDAGPR